jgi:hypothetical protein
MLTKFGVLEAQLAGFFAKNKEQKETVFAMLTLMGIPITIKEQAKKIKTRLLKGIKIKNDKIISLNTKTFKVSESLGKLEEEKIAVEVTEDVWNL